MNATERFISGTLRLKQWTKNLLIFLPLFLHNSFTDTHLLLRSVIGFFSFCMMASCCYILNDIRDIEHDRLHRRKQERPIASGRIGVVNASVIALILMTAALIISALLGRYALLFLVIYFLLNWIYSGPVKRIKYLDILVLSSFYLLRLFYAWGLTRIMLTDLFILTCSFLFLAASSHKRYIECLQSTSLHISGRGYSRNDMQILRILTIVFALLAIASFNLHAITVLRIHSPIWIGTINILAGAIFYFFFETKTNSFDDPIDRILKKPYLLLLSLLFASLYIYLVITKL